MLKLILIKLDPGFDFTKYLTWFSIETKNKINSFHKTADQVTAFSSAVLKYYYLPYLLGLKPAEIQIKINKYGKPFLVNQPEIDFSITHSKDYIMLGVATQHKIGIDLEEINPQIDLSLKELAFSKTEAALISTPQDFFILWAKKEAYLKCLSVGFMDTSYLQTKLSLNLEESFNSYQVNCRIFKNNYTLAICLSN